VVEKSRQEKCDRKIMATKVRQKNRGKKSVAEKSRQEKCDRKIVATKVQQKNHGKKSAEKKSRQQNATRRKRYGFHMYSVESMNLVEGLPCKYIVCPLGSLGLVVELI
jgi:hypothetical protein